MGIYGIVSVAFLVLYLGVGFWAGRNTKSSFDYYVMSRNAPAYQITGTLLASNASSVTLIGYTSSAYSGGPLPMTLVWVMSSIASLILGLWIGKYLYRMELTTIPDFFEKRYPSKPVHILASAIVLFSMTFYVISVLLGARVAMQSLLGWSPTASFFSILLLITLFTIVGGMRSVVITDTLMFVVFFIASIALGSSIFIKLGGIGPAIEQAVASSQYIFSWTGKKSTFDGFMQFMENNVLSFIMILGAPHLISRINIARSERELAKSMVYLAVLLPIFAIFLVYSFGYLPLVTADISPETAYPWVSENLVPSIIGALGLAGVMAAAISTASSLFQQAASTLSHDIYKRFIKPDMNDIELLKVSRISVVIIALVVLVFSLIPQFGSATILYAFLFATSAFAAWLPSIILGVLWKGATTQGAFWSMLISFILTIALGLGRQTGLTPMWLAPNVMGLITSTLIMIIVSIMTNKSKDGKAQAVKIN